MNIKEDILIERFLNNKLSETARNQVLERMDSDTLFKEKVFFEQQLVETLDENNWSFVKNINTTEQKEYEDLFNDKGIKKIKESIAIANENFKKKKPFSFKKWYLYSSAAVIALLISIFLFTPNDQTSKDIYVNYINAVEIPSIDSRGDDKQFKELSRAQNYFENKEYSKAAKIFSTAFKNNSQNSNIYLYLAISKMELNQFIEAEKILNSLINSNLIDAEKGYWFKSLLYLKSNQIEKVKTTLSLIIKNSYFNNKKAKELLVSLSSL